MTKHRTSSARASRRSAPSKSAGEGAGESRPPDARNASPATKRHIESRNSGSAATPERALVRVSSTRDAGPNAIAPPPRPWNLDARGPLVASPRPSPPEPTNTAPALDPSPVCSARRCARIDAYPRPPRSRAPLRLRLGGRPSSPGA